MILWIRRSFTVLFILLQQALPMGGTAATPTQGTHLRRFTVADSVEMTKLIDPRVELARYFPAAIKISPDGRRFVIVTRKGNLANDQNDYALTLFETMDVLNFLGMKGDAGRPEGTKLLQVSSSSNQDPIQQIRWLDDSKTLAFLGEIDGTSRQVYSLDSLSGGKPRQLTHHPRPVESFDLGLGTDLMIFVSSVPSYPDGRGKTSYVVGNKNIYELMYLDEELPGSKHQYYAAPKGSKAPATAIGTTFISQFLDTWLSPDGRWAIGVQSPQRVPTHWGENYVPFTRNWYFREIAQTFDEETMKPQDIVFHFVLIDLVAGSVAPVFDAPAGAFLGGGNKLDALWSPDSSSVVLANTFLPLDVADAQERERRKQVPAIVEFEIKTRQLRRIADLKGSEPDGKRVQFMDMAWTGNGILRIESRSSEGRLSARVYRRRRDAWKPQATRGVRAQTEIRSSALALSIRQGLNIPPDILARDTRTGREKVITDLNPRFRQLQLGTVEPFEWSDSRKRRWLGGVVYPPDFKRGDRYPLVIQTYGFHPGEFMLDGAPGFSSAFAARALANRGMLVLQVPTASQVRSGPPIADGEPQEIESARIAIEAAIDRLDEIGLIDRKRVGIVGFSRTGLHVQDLITFSDHVFAAATIADSFHISLLEYIGLFGGASPGMLEVERLVGARPWGDELEKWVARDPVLHLDRVYTPLRLELYQSRGLYSWWDTYAILKRMHRPVEFVHFPEGAHNLVRPSQRLASLQGNVDWFAFWLKGEEDPDPAKAEQYERWRRLRQDHQASLRPANENAP